MSVLLSVDCMDRPQVKACAAVLDAYMNVHRLNPPIHLDIPLLKQAVIVLLLVWPDVCRRTRPTSPSLQKVRLVPLLLDDRVFD